MQKKTWIRRAAPAALLGSMLGACDFISISDADPNTVSDPTMAQLFVAVEVNSFLFAEGELARTSAVFTQQLTGLERQYGTLNRYEFTEAHVDGEFSGIYTGGGLVDIRQGIAKAQAANCAGCKGMFQIHEAYLIGMAASIFGDIPYSQAINAAEFPTPQLDDQAQVYAAVQVLLDDAISNLNGAGTVGALASADFNFRGNASAWSKVAHTLKARYYLHWVEAQRAGGASAALAQTACAGDCTAKAAASARLGITTNAGNWRAIHSEASTEQNLFFLFNQQRSGYVGEGGFLVNLLTQRNDPRRTFYFSNGSLNVSSTGVAAPGYDQPIVSCAENNFILAEALHYQGATSAAQAALTSGVRCAEGQAGVAANSITAASGATGAALLKEIIEQKYIALFLNMEVFNDYKRTCLPAITPLLPTGVPGRLLYGRTERQTNPNIPAPDAQPARNDNDPRSCV